METLYDILEVSRKASKEIIEKAYKTLAKKYHPDLQMTEEDKKIAEEKMKKINEAYSVLGNEEKKAEYDYKLQQQEEQNARSTENPTYYQETGYERKNQEYYNQPNVTQENYNQQPNEYDREWRNEFANLSKKEQKKTAKKIQKEASEEYRKQYENYFRSLGFKIKHKWTFKDFLTVLLVLVAVAIIICLLWIIPPTHAYMLNVYNSNVVVRILVNVVIGIFKGIVRFFQNFTKF